MKNAGKNIFEIIEKNFNKKKNIKILCGPGNNGGDAFVVAKLLRQKGFYNINLFSLVAQKDLKGDVKQAAIESKLPLINFKNFKISKNDLIIDGIFGSGLKRNITGNIKTKEHVIRRALKIKEGSLFINKSISDSRETLLKLGLFKSI